MSDLDSLKSELIAAIDGAGDTAALEAARVGALGKKGRLTELMKGLGELQGEARKQQGQALNQLRAAIEGALAAKKAALEAAALDVKLAAERIDVTLPPRPLPQGRIHPLSQCMEEVAAIFGEMGFTVVEGPDIESDWHNFTALNMPPEHPARQMHDTFYLAERGEAGEPAHLHEGAMVGESPERAIRLLRTHTSPVQARTMLSQKPPIRILVPGRCFRKDSDMTHTPMFHQFEGLVIDEATHMGHLKGCLIDFCRAYFEVDDVPVRFRPSHFPFTEPSAEVDVRCFKCGGDGCRFCRESGWLEILGSGMVHPNVLRNVGYDPEEVTGWAFGMGIDRIALLKYEIDDIRLFFDNDLRFLQQFAGLPGR
jgi:phenylalanyl-tRNA synthetase alpha chain